MGGRRVNDGLLDADAFAQVRDEVLAIVQKRLMADVPNMMATIRGAA